MIKPLMAIMTYTNYDTDWERVRSECILKTLAEIKKVGYDIVLVDGGSPADFIEKMKALGVEVHSQDVPGMGNGGRETLRLARDTATEDQPIVWIEPEKYTLVSQLQPAVDDFKHSQLDMLLFKRLSLDTYPPEQAMMYQMIALATKYLTGIDSDFGWGPMILSKKAIQYFLDYKSDYGDTWDSRLCPRLAVINAGLPWKNFPIDYRHPAEQTAAETGMALFSKRIKQIEQVVNAITGEVDKLGMRKDA